MVLQWWDPTFTHGRSVRISPVSAQSKPQKVQFSLSIRDQTMETPVDRQGHGFQRALLIAALKLLADRGAAAEQQGVICLAVEEPELFQHPVQARAFASVLRKLAEDDRQRFQVTYATHSPFFIEATHFPQVRRVSRSNGGPSQTPTVDIAQVALDQVINRLAGFVDPDTVRKRMDAVCLQKLPEAVFAETVVLVEGTTDQGVIEGHAAREGIVLASEGTLVVEGGGKDSILLPHAILTMLGIPCYLVFDGDKRCVPTERANQSKHNRNILRYLEVAEEDWPISGAYDRYTAFEDCLETELTEKWPAWEIRRGELVNSGIGFPKNTGRRTDARPSKRLTRPQTCSLKCFLHYGACGPGSSQSSSLRTRIPYPAPPNPRSSPGPGPETTVVLRPEDARHPL